MYRMYLNKVLFPVVPSKITISSKSKNTTLTLLNEGEVSRIKVPGLREITIDELLLPAIQKYPFANWENGFHKANYYTKILQTWRKKKTPVKFKLIRTSPAGKQMWDDNITVTIEDMEITEDVNDGLDVTVKLTLREYKAWGAQKIRKKKEKSKTCTVKKGDTLTKIAKRELDDSSKSKEIYKLNKKTIETAAKKNGRKSSSNGYYLYVGTRLKLPS